MEGMGFWIPQLVTGFFCLTPELPDGEGVIFFFEALCVCTAVHWVANTLSADLRKRVTVHTDNTNTVSIFNSLKASPVYNPILKSAVDVMISHSIDLRVLHIPGSENDVTDALSCSDFSDFSRARNLVPELIILPFLPLKTCWGCQDVDRTHAWVQTVGS